MVDSKLTKMSDNRYVMPGRSCGILNPVKFINELPKNEEEIQPCTIIDLTAKTRENGACNLNFFTQKSKIHLNQ